MCISHLQHTSIQTSFFQTFANNGWLEATELDGVGLEYAARAVLGVGAYLPSDPRETLA